MDIDGKKKRTPIIEDSSSSEEDAFENEKENADEQLQTTSASKVTPRSSERILQKRNRKFAMPSKRELWEKITPSKSPGKIDQIRPKKLVNNFTKENSRYNYDPNETSGEESMEDFLDDDDDVDMDTSSDDNDAAVSKKDVKKTPRIKGRHNRLRTISQLEESSSENDVKYDDNDDCYRLNRDLNAVTKTRDNKTAFIDSDNDDNGNTNGATYDDDNDNDSGDCNDDNLSDENNGLRVTSRGKRNRSLIESDNDDDDDESDGDVRQRKKQNKSIIESDSDENDESCGEDIKPELNVHIKTEPGTETHHLESMKDSSAHNNATGSETTLVKCSTVPIDRIKEEMCSGTSRSTDNDINTPSASIVTTHIKKEVETSDDNDETDGDDDDDNNGENDGNDDDGDNNDDDGGDSDGECDSDYNSSDCSDDIDESIENSRVRVRKLLKKKQNEKLFNKLREERQRKLAKLKTKSCNDKN